MDYGNYEIYDFDRVSAFNNHFLWEAYSVTISFLLLLSQS